MSDQRTREFLQGYAACLADLYRVGGHAPVVMKLMDDAGVNYHTFRDAGVEAYDLGELAKARDTMKRLASQTGRET